MIVFEDRIKEITDQLPQIEGFDVDFYWVKDSKDVNQYITLKDPTFPVIFLLTGTEKGREDHLEVRKNCKFVLAVQELKPDKLNDDRWNDSYDTFLNPLASKLIEAISVSNISKFVRGSDGFDYELLRIPNYSEADKNAQIDKWDVIEINATVIVNGDCLRTIHFE